MRNFKVILGLLLAATVALNSCVKETYDSPPSTATFDPNVPVNVKIKDLTNWAFNNSAGWSHQFIGDSTIYGIVTADDRSGNFYKQIVIQDSTGGIVILIATTNLYADYPVGRKIYIKLKNLYITNYKGLPEIAFFVDSTGATTGMPSSLVANYIVKSTFPNTVTPALVTLTDVASNPYKYINALVTFKSVEFASGSNGITYANPSAVSVGTARTITDCVGGNITLYNSGYANFQPYRTPNGTGTLTGIYSIYGSSAQFLIRDTTDVNMTSPRACP